jgi:two-component system, NarL family, sensor histidine kinase DevS
MGGQSERSEENGTVPHDVSAAAPGHGPLLPHMRLDELLAELQSRLEAVLATRDRTHALLEAVVAIGSDLDLSTMLRRMVEAATTLVDATYGALGVIGEGGNSLIEFIPVGLSDEQIRRIEHWPHGLGILGLLIKEPEPLRLNDIGRHPESYGFPPGHPPMRTFLGVPIRVRGEAFGNLYLTEKRGGAEFDEEDLSVVTALATAAGVAIENARLYDEVRRRERWLDASSEVTRALLSGVDRREVFALVARRAREMTEAETAAVALAADDGEALVVEAADGAYTEVMRGMRLPVQGSLPGQVLRDGKPVTLDDAHDDAAISKALGTTPIGPTLIVPLGAGGSVHGLLGVAMSEGKPPFTDAAGRMLQAFGEQAGIVLELAERRADAERLTMLEDRDRIAKDLHDLVIQRLFATGLGLQATAQRARDPEIEQRLASYVAALDDTIREIRQTIFSLRSAEEKGESLRHEVLGILQEAAEVLSFEPSVHFDGPVDSAVPTAVAGQVSAVLREALTNIGRHAAASSAWVELAVTGAAVRLTVRDDGIGLPEQRHDSGLSNLTKRAEELGGWLDARTVQPHGTELVWQVPLVT